MAWLVAAGCSPGDSGMDAQQPLSVVEALRGDPGSDAEFARALEPIEMQFPADHGVHPEFRTEWWYFTGNLAAADPAGRAFGFQLTFFRSAITSQPVSRSSSFAAGNIWMAHLALTDAGGQRFVSFDRFARGGAIGLAGCESAPFRVFVEDWSAASSEVDFLPLRLTARDGDVELELDLSAGKELVLQGDRGLSQKSSEPGNASYYYSMTRLPAAGRIRWGEDSFDVAGAAWFDREWGTSALGDDQVGWDWFALQFNDGSELMFYQLRRTDGSADPASSGICVARDGSSVRLRRDEVTLEVVDHWVSPRTLAHYPAAWRMRVPKQRLELTIEPVLADQELDVAVKYWEGAVRVSGKRGSAALAGRGYVELTGYRSESGARPAAEGR